MKLLWHLVWVLLIAQLIMLPFWHKLIGKVIKRKFPRKILNSGSYLAIFLILLASLLSLSLRIGKRNMSAKMEPPKAISSAASADEYGFVDIRGQIHVHCYLSHDSKGTMEELSQAAARDGIRWIILTDHLRKLPPGNYPDYVNGVLFIYGSERNGPEGSSQFWASLKDPKPGLHLHGHLENFCKFDEEKVGSGLIIESAAIDGIELVNFHANALISKFRIVRSAFFDPGSMYDGVIEPLPQLFNYWQTLATKAGRPIPIFAAPDAHQNQKILGVQMDPYELILGLISTHIWLEKDQELNQAAIFEAIKKGRTYIAFDYLGDPTGFQLIAERKDKNFFTGDSVEKPDHIRVRLPDSLLVDKSTWNTSELEMKFYRDNRQVGLIDHFPFYSTDYKPGVWLLQPGFWRVEIWRNGKLWIISGQILVK